MDKHDHNTVESDFRLAERLKALRADRGWSLDELAQRSNISRATLSRMEKCEVSPTANVLGRLCAAYDMTLSRLMSMVEAQYAPVVRRLKQPVWIDAETGFERRSVSPPAENLACEVLSCYLPPDVTIDYPVPPKAGLEHHLVMLEGELELSIEGKVYQLEPGDCLRYKLHGSSVFRAHKKLGARYFLVVV